MKRTKKSNPSKMPATLTKEEARRMIGEETQTISTLVWIALISAVIDFKDMSKDAIFEMVEKIKAYPLHIGDKPELFVEKSKVISGLDLSYRRIQASAIRTQRELNLCQKIIHENAVAVSFSYMIAAISELELLDKSRIPAVFQRAYMNFIEIETGELTINDINWALEQEYGMVLGLDEEQIGIYEIEEETISTKGPM